jgi:hypothetical protein
LEESEIDNCPICGRPCETEADYADYEGLNQVDRERVEIIYATCKTCKTKWRRREDSKNLGRLIYEKWAYRIPEFNISIPIIGSSIKLKPRGGRWIKIKERYIPVGYSEEILAAKMSTEGDSYDEIISVSPKEPSFYMFALSKGDKVIGEIKSDTVINVWFLDEDNFEKFSRSKRYSVEDGTESIFEARSIGFEASKKGTWVVMIENKSRKRAKVHVNLSSVAKGFFV